MKQLSNLENFFFIKVKMFSSLNYLPALHGSRNFCGRIIYFFGNLKVMLLYAIVIRKQRTMQYNEVHLQQVINFIKKLQKHE